jgi:hypothetical protein
MEKQTLEAARRASSLFPHGEVELFDEPDLRINTGAGLLYVEHTELVRPAIENGFRPVEAESFHRGVVRLAEKFYRESGGRPVAVLALFLDDQRSKLENPDGWHRLTERKTGSKREKMARSLAEFVKERYVPGAGTITFKWRNELPTGFEVISISPPLHSSWQTSESGNIEPLDAEQLAAIIREKNEILPKYRARGSNSPIWLLIASGPSVAKGVPIPKGIGEWKFAFDFDRVLLFSGMDNKVFEIDHV